MAISNILIDKFLLEFKSPTVEQLDSAIYVVYDTVLSRIHLIEDKRFVFYVEDLPSKKLLGLKNKSFMGDVLEGGILKVTLDPYFAYLVVLLNTSVFRRQNYYVGPDPFIYFPGSPLKFSDILKQLEFGNSDFESPKLFTSALNRASKLTIVEERNEYYGLRRRCFELYKKYVFKYGVGISISSIQESSSQK